MTATLHINDETGGSRLDRGRLERAVQAAISEGRPDGGEIGDVEISVTLVDAEAMRSLNREYHGRDQATDVLAFGLDPAPRSAGDPEGRLDLLGDVYVCPPQAAEAARELGIEEGEELLRLAIHGVLHLLGYDHPDGDERYASEMFAVQERLLSELGG